MPFLFEQTKSTLINVTQQVKNHITMNYRKNIKKNLRINFDESN
tara:strand:- start:1374 stop:1505 length:132 start_codon:yes stop_codon:yes gene_type:complete